MTITTLYSVHAVNADKLAEVTAEMQTLGAPTIRVVDCGDYYQAIEGVHRLEAACQLGIAPELVVLTQDELVPADTLDFQDHFQAGESYAAGEIAGEMNPGFEHASIYRLNPDGTLEQVMRL